MTQKKTTAKKSAARKAPKKAESAASETSERSEQSDNQKMKPKTNFNNYVQEANLFLKETCEALGTDNKDQAYRILRAVLHTLREKLELNESFHLISQLPLIIKGIYVDGWRPSQSGLHINTVEDFTDEVVYHNRMGALKDFENPEDVEKAVQAVFSVLQNHVTEGELEHIRVQLSEELCDFLFGEGEGLSDVPRSGRQPAMRGGRHPGWQQRQRDFNYGYERQPYFEGPPKHFERFPDFEGNGGRRFEQGYNPRYERAPRFYPPAEQHPYPHPSRYGRRS